jgi:hypothetical protein
MLISHWRPIPTTFSLVVVAGIIIASILISMIVGRKVKKG